MKKTSWKMWVMLAGFFAAATVFADDQAVNVLSEIHHANQMEIHLGMMAKEKSQSPDVKAYAERLVKDHQEADDDVLSLAKQDGITLQTTPAGEKTMAELSAKSGADFDKEFAKIMVEDHKKTIAKLQKADQTLTQPDVKALVEKILPTLQQHLAMAQKLYSNS